MLQLFVKVNTWRRRFLSEERGAIDTIVGWVGVGAVSLVIILMVYKAVTDDNSIGGMVLAKIKSSLGAMPSGADK